MERITRRLFIGTAAVAGATGAAIAIPAVAEAKAEMSAKERFDFHLAELKKAAVELDPRIGSWSALRAEDDELNCALVITAFRVTGRYEGDGAYEAGSANWNGSRTKYQVRLLDHRTDGHRMFEVKTSMSRMVLAEPRLNTFIGRRVA